MMAPNVLEDEVRPNEINRSVAELIRALTGFQSLPGEIRSLWTQLMEKAVKEDTIERLHADREMFDEYLSEWIQSMVGFVEFARLLLGSSISLSPKVAELNRALAELREFHQTLLGRWKTLEDLEDIIA